MRQTTNNRRQYGGLKVILEIVLEVILKTKQENKGGCRK